MKKWLVLILLLITAAGTFIPCCQEDDCYDETCSSTTNHENEEKGSCSPFYSCATCTGFVQLSKPIQLGQPLVAKLQHHETIKVIHLPTYAGSFWQPPRLAS